MSANRHIVSFAVHGEPFLYKDWEYVELRVKEILNFIDNMKTKS